MKPEKERERDYGNYTTANEIRYIQNIGKEGAQHNLAVKNASRVKLLKNYIKSCYHRKWPKDMDGNACLNAAMKELDNAQRGR